MKKLKITNYKQNYLRMTSMSVIQDIVDCDNMTVLLLYRF